MYSNLGDVPEYTFSADNKICEDCRRKKCDIVFLIIVLVFLAGMFFKLLWDYKNLGIKYARLSNHYTQCEEKLTECQKRPFLKHNF